MPQQKILTITTLRDSLRADVDSWGWECDADNIRSDRPISLSSNGRCSVYDCPLRAIADGWRLLGPPVVDEQYAYDSDKQQWMTGYTWWFERFN